MRVVVPYAPGDPKTRLEPVLSPSERSQLARAMLEDVLDGIAETGHTPTVLSTRDVDIDAPVTVDDRSLTVAVNERLPSSSNPDPVAVVMADLALATPDALERLFAREVDVTIAPGRGGGTNAIVVRHPEFHVDYHGASYCDHRQIAAGAGLTVETVDSLRLGTDIDDPADLVDALVYGRERTIDCLRSFGIEREIRNDQLEVVRRRNPSEL